MLMAATNFLDAVDPALVREGRFDVKLRLDLPDRATRAQILRSQLSARPCGRFDVQPFAVRTAGASAARLKTLVDRAAAYAAEQNRRIGAADLQRVLDESGGEDRPLLQPVDWSEVVVSADVERELRTWVALLNRKSSDDLGVELPTGLLLVGPPGTGKSLIARLIASQTRRSFYPITPADVLGAGVGDSVKRIRQVFARARENAPSIILFEEVDGLAPRNYGQLSSHDVQLTEQLLIETSKLEPAEGVFLIATSNDIERLHPRLLRGGRFSDKLVVGLPDREGCARLLSRFLGSTKLAADTSTPAQYVESGSVVDPLQAWTPAPRACH